MWADLANEFLERNNRPERIDHRSYERQGIDQIPTVHIGVAASQMEKKGIATERGELNRSIKEANRLLRDIKTQIGKLKEWLIDVFKAKESFFVFLVCRICAANVGAQIAGIDKANDIAFCRLYL